ncbi:DUF2148 domain-containing protein [Elusimicrobiota bacterium]
MSIEKGVRDIANFIEIAARTAPKARGIDNIIITVFEKDEMGGLADKMIETGKGTSRPQTFERDAACVRQSECAVIIGTIQKTIGLDCGFCGLPDCSSAEEKGITCAYNSGDLGIAAGSAVAQAAAFHIDNRILYTMGYTAVKNNMLEKDVVMALGIPLSATGKNIFFDRK